ncbi:Tfp pilus assembly protein FimT/FimU [Capilliphycus salinus ALCB114379]|uniref:pilus assembly FimT family protein n=1 Tax=Capilliphycus salinus TaxID=2768948 RepID=UPI0039A6B896
MKLNTRSKCDRQISHNYFTSNSSSSKVRYTAGYTIIEILLILGIIGIFSGIAVPAWIGFFSRQELRTGATRVYWAMRSAQSEAKRQKTSVQASFREKDNRVEWAVHLASIPPDELSEKAWESLPQGVEIDRGENETTLRKINPDTNEVTTSETNYYRALFNYKGCPVYNPNNDCTKTSIQALGRLGLKHKNLKKQKRCVIISTLIGVVRIGQENPKPKDDRYCY